MHLRTIATASLLAFAASVASHHGAAAQSVAPGFVPAPSTVQESPRQVETRKKVRPHGKHRVSHRKEGKRKEAQRDLMDLARRQGFKPVSELVHFPKFFPGLGIIYVKPETLPLGPFECFDRSKRLIATVYMVPIKDIDDHKTLEAKAPGFAGKVDHTTFYFNPGHPGVDVPLLPPGAVARDQAGRGSRGAMSCRWFEPRPIRS